MISEANMILTDGQHREWFIASLMPHLRRAVEVNNLGKGLRAHDEAS